MLQLALMLLMLVQTSWCHQHLVDSDENTVR
jgi:methionine-rich copper-binding protein CopC